MKYLLVFLYFLLLISCGEKNQRDISPDSSGTVSSTETSPASEYNSAIIIPGSDVVLYPIGSTNQRSSSLRSEYSYQASTYWNVLFFNTETKEAHLLSQKSLLIYSIHTHIGDQAQGVLSPYIFYIITSEDYNQDGKLDNKDPRYLFVSDLKGNNLRQISPSGYSIHNWQVIHKTRKVLIEAFKDTNGDKVFTGEDKLIPLIYEDETGKTAEEVVSKEMQKKLDELYKKIWLK
ncbi:MAG: hypothetical protein H7A25_00200 [Leptospiraceae bacterium]|nr:hypothetical protein [Leptospiraceae bacterium]MCP5498296.1 hypothetical protein [Leptospiraceae bacterium]